MIRDSVCGECGKQFTPLKENQRVCEECMQIENYIMLRSNRWCSNCLS